MSINLQPSGVLQNSVVNVPPNCWEETLTQLWSSNFRNSTLEKITIAVAEVALIQVSFPKVASKQKKNKNENTEYHGISMPFKIQVFSKRGSPTFLLFELWSFW